MNREQRALALFEQAAELADPDEFLTRECGDDAELLAEVRALLDADRRAGHFIAQPISFELQREGQQVGPWRLLRRIGAGGMGTVHLAESMLDATAPRGALKLLRWDAPDLRQRFELERRILAGLDHPAIARLLDAGTGADGAPYLVLEYVDGLPLTEYAKREKLSPRACTTLLIEVLAAVQYAHARLVLHRDLKPSNILVGCDGRPKLLDFGIAKLIGEGQRGLTLTGPGPMTPEYASPEQVRGLTLHTSSDVYALGVVLYELLTTRRPYEFAKATASEVERTICEAMPARPSTLAPKLSRDYDHILGKALAKSSADRYRSCAEFAEDLQRLLDGLPVRARAATPGYRLARFLWRHRLGLALTASVFFALATLTALAWRNAERATRATADAVRERDAEREVQSWLERMLASADPRVIGHAPSAAELLDGAAATLGSGLASRPEIEISLRLTLAQAYRGLGLAEAAQREADRALALVGDAAAATLRAKALRVHAQTLADLGRYDQALADVELALTVLGEGASLERSRSLAFRAFIHSRQGALDAADADYRAALAAFAGDAGLATEHAEVLNNHGVLQGMREEFADALDLHLRARALLEAEVGVDHPLTLLAAVNAASARESLGEIVAAEAEYRSLLPKLEARLGAGHADVVRVSSTLAFLLMDAGRDEEAATLMRGVAATARESLPASHSMRAYAESTLGAALLGSGDAAAAVQPLRAALSSRRESLPAGHPLLISSECALLEAQAGTGDRAARVRIAELLAESTAALGNEHPIILRCRERQRRVEVSPRD